MGKYLIKRILLSLLIIWGVLSLTFLILHIAPGDPASVYISPDVPPEVVENIRHTMGLDKPLLQQYVLWMREFLTGNFGFSLFYKKPIGQILGRAIPNTLQLTIVVFVLQLFLGTLLGIFCGIKQNTRVDSIIDSGLLVLYSVPGFWLALIAIRVFSYSLGWLPSSQMASLAISGEFWTVFADRLKHLVLPVLVLSAPFIAYTARFVRGSYREVLNQNYIRTARAYGLKKEDIYFRFALKNALLPLGTLIGLYLPFLLSGAVITEYIFAWPGMGRVTIEAIFTHDFPLILATTFIGASAVVLGNLLSDLFYLIVDPRIKLAGG